MICNWTTTNDDTAFILQTQLVTPQAFAENHLQAQDAIVYIAMLNVRSKLQIFVACGWIMGLP